MREITLHLLDIAQNSVSAAARNIEISVEEDLHTDRLKAVVQDDGRGMDEDLLERVVDPFVTSRTTRKVGLGIPLLKAAAEACNGGLWIASRPGQWDASRSCLSTQSHRPYALGRSGGHHAHPGGGLPAHSLTFQYRGDGAEFILTTNQ